MSFLLVLGESLKEAGVIYLHYWWFFTPLFLWPLFRLLWVNYIQDKYISGLKWYLLEIKVPADLEIRPKTMEELFSALATSYDVVIDTLYDIYLSGAVDTWFSFEIVSFEGDIHFYIRTTDTGRPLVEPQIYAMHPDAEIVEVDDYVDSVPADAPNEEYDLWGTDFKLAKESAYPIRTYEEFEDNPSGEFIDPVSNIVEGVSKLGQGEQIWIQILVRATNDAWREEGRRIVLERAGRIKPSSRESDNFLVFAFREIIDVARHVAFDFFNLQENMGGSEEASTKEDLPSMMLHLSSGERKIIDLIDKKIEKPAFETDIRYIYVAKRAVFNKTKANTVAFGYVVSKGAEYINQLIPDSATKTSAYYYLADMRKAVRKRIILDKYRRRLLDKRSYVLAADELATIFHMPTKLVNAPVVEARKGKPPETLPI